MRGPHAPNPPTSLPMKLPTFFSLSLSLSRSSPSPLSLLLALAFCLFISFGGFREKVWMDLPRADAPLPLPFGDGREFFRPPAFRARLPFPPSPSSSSPRCFSFRLPWPGLAVGMEIGIDELDGRSARTAGRCTKMVYVDVGLSAGRIRPCHYCHRQALVQRKGARLRAPECFSLGAVYLCHFCFFFFIYFYIVVPSGNVAHGSPVCFVLERNNGDVYFDDATTSTSWEGGLDVSFLEYARNLRIFIIKVEIENYNGY